MIAICRRPARKPTGNRSRRKPIDDVPQIAARKRDVQLDYIHNEEFELQSADDAILKRALKVPAKLLEQTAPASAGKQAYFAGLYEVALLTPEEERDLFRRFNYLKFKANRLLKDQTKPTAKIRKQYDRLMAEASEAKEHLIRANLRLVVSIAKRFVNEENTFEDLVSDGNVALMRAVEKFNYELGNRFSTYATYAIQRCVFRSISQLRQRRRRFVFDDTGLDGAMQTESEPILTDVQISSLHELFEQMLEELDAREQHIVRKRFGLDESEPQSFKQLGDEMGVCKERVRQIQTRAIAKLQLLARQRRLEEYLDPGQ